MWLSDQDQHDPSTYTNAIKGYDLRTWVIKANAIKITETSLSAIDTWWFSKADLAPSYTIAKDWYYVRVGNIY